MNDFQPVPVPQYPPQPGYAPQSAQPAQQPQPGSRTTPPGAPVLQASGLQKHYGPTAALAGVNLSVRVGESVAIMGPSGSGKTTLLHTLAGMILPDAGQVVLSPGATAQPGATQPGAAPLDITAASAATRTALRRTTFGFVFQQGLLLPELTAEENVAVAAMLTGVPRTPATGQAREQLARVGLTEHAGKRIGQLSGGQAQRVAIARAQANDPAIVFADEPTGALDSQTGAQVLHLLLGSTTGRGRTLILVTHDETVAAACDRTVRLRDGRIVSDTSTGTTVGFGAEAPAGTGAGPQQSQPAWVQPGQAQPASGTHPSSTPNPDQGAWS